MNTETWVMMICTWTVVASCTGYCFFRLLTSKRDLKSDD